MKTIDYNGTRHEFPDDFTDADIAAALRSMDAEGGAAPAQATRVGAPASGFRQPLPEWLLRGNVNALPAYGAMVGGLLGSAEMPGVGTYIGTGLGASGGEAIRQLLARGLGMPAPQSPLEAMGGINREANLQSMLGFGGERIGAALPGMASRAAYTATRPSVGLQRLYPRIGETMLNRGLKVGPGMEGTAGAESALQGAQAQLDNIIDALPPQSRLNRQVVFARVNRWIDDLRRSTVGAEGKSKAGVKLLQALERTFPGSKGEWNPITKEFDRFLAPQEVREIGQRARKAVENILIEKAKPGYSPRRSQDLIEGFNMALYNGTRDAFERQYPTVAKAIGQVHDLLGAKKAIEDAELGMRAGRAPVGPGFRAGPIQIEGQLIPKRVASRAALLLNQPWFQRFAKSSPNAAAAMLKFYSGASQGGNP